MISLIPIRVWLVQTVMSAAVVRPQISNSCSASFFIGPLDYPWRSIPALILQEVHQNQPDRVAVGELKAERDSWRGKRWEMRLGNGWQMANAGKLSLKCKNDFRADGFRRDALCCTGVILAFLQPCLELLCDCEKLNC